ncbi:hypothetical protein FRACYDRAFT_249511 [Fragilariopsis cylindrus CCMP1102]|uniref:Myb-like domain-containing protein n=1 Tax=Fragilariopsis cylindrus CCMP1102 TaxID=635003 RepID=A0A1E7ERK0_9STRA|nr:hypothetical protein FRACYDRAFT_249511 [Fragilariopsis cylindrus CCMP1102]|eukprot:OEU08618.1 hypothetical protein FRACYDRAFT_249511 [Fragilariopsis cylindrus CCMP1102]
MVKKEEEEEEEEEEGENDNETAPTPESSSNDDYSDWKKGNWCWLLPATITNNDSIIIKNETRENDIVCTTCVTHHSAKSEDDDGGTNSNTANSATTTNGITEEDDEDEDDEEEEEEINADEINADEASKTPTNDNDKDKDNNGDDEEEGYESWTEGNWCRLLPVAIETTGPSTKSRRNHKFSHQHYFEGDDDNNSGDEDYIADDDDAKNGSSAKAKTKGKSIKIGYTRLQNDRWNEMFQRLVAYKKNHRSLYTCLTPTPNRYAEDPQLGDWVMKQRRCYKNTEISVERIRRLDYIGFVWKIKEHVPWMEMYQRLVVYKNRHKSINIPSKYADDPKLAKWVNNQRGSYTKNGLSIERINLLESIGFVWDRSDAQWMGMYSKLVAYKKQNKSTQVPIYYTEPLRKWVCTQRRSNKCDKARLSEKRLQLLNSINFAWSVRKDDGDEKTAATTTKTNREPWETSEDKKLVKLVQKTTHKTKNVFVDIARQIEGKDWIQCKYRWYCIKKDIPVVKVKPSNKPWDSREDRKLIRLVNKMTHTFATTTTTATNIYCKDFEEKNLDLEEIAHQFKGKRTSRQCINRWDFIKKRSAVAEAAAAEIAAVAIAGGGGGGHGIDDHPNKKPPPPSNNDRHNNWTTTEDNALNVLVDAYGKEWTEITKYMPGREEDAIKKRWNYIGTTCINSNNVHIGRTGLLDWTGLDWTGLDLFK